MRLDDAIASYLDSLQVEGRSPRTVAAYRRDLGRLEAHFGADHDVGTVTPQDLLAFAASDLVRLQADGSVRHAATTNRTRTAVRGMFDFLARTWAIGADPAKVLRVRTTRPKRPNLLTDDDERRLVEAMAGDPSWQARRDLLMVRVMLATGIRLGSAVALDIEDVDVAHERLHVPMKGERRMVVALDLELGQEVLAGHARGPGALFRSARGARISERQVQLRFAEWLAKAGVTAPVTVHSLRHSFGTRMYERTRDIRRVQVALGHRSVVTTERYVAV